MIVDPVWFIGSDYEQKNLRRVVQRFLADENISAGFGPTEVGRVFNWRPA